MQQKAVKFSLPSKKNERQRRVILGLGGKLSTDCLQEAEERGGDGGRPAGAALSSSLPREDAEPPAKHVRWLM